MKEGIIARKVSDRRFGFIKSEGADRDIFFHEKEVKGTTFDELKEGDKVTFDVQDSKKGPNAVNVMKA